MKPLQKPIHTKGRTIGLLGGSFNPAHRGHLHITLYALNTLHFDEVWWLVSPRNPLKSLSSLESYEKRLHSARRIAAPYRRIRVMDVEAGWKTRYSFQTIDLLKAHYPAAHFVWMMGADNLAQFHRWRRWQQIIAQLPMVVFDRAPYSHTAQRSKTFLRGRKFLLNLNNMQLFSTCPLMAFIHLKRDPLSSTYLRKKLGAEAFLGHNINAGDD